MKHMWLALVLAAACGNSDHGRGVIENSPQDLVEDKPAAAPAPTPTPAPAAKPVAAPVPDPTLPADIDRARNQAMIDGRDKDVLHFCELGKLDAKSNPQALLGCTLAACRIKDEPTAQRYAKPLAKDYMEQARRVCATNQIAL